MFGSRIKSTLVSCCWHFSLVFKKYANKFVTSWQELLMGGCNSLLGWRTWCLCHLGWCICYIRWNIQYMVKWIDIRWWDMWRMGHTNGANWWWWWCAKIYCRRRRTGCLVHPHLSVLAVTVAHAPRLCLPRTNVIPSNPSSPGRWECLLVAIREHSSDNKSSAETIELRSGRQWFSRRWETENWELQFNATNLPLDPVYVEEKQMMSLKGSHSCWSWERGLRRRNVGGWNWDSEVLYVWIGWWPSDIEAGWCAAYFCRKEASQVFLLLLHRHRPARHQGLLRPFGSTATHHRPVTTNFPIKRSLADHT